MKRFSKHASLVGLGLICLIVLLAGIALTTPSRPTADIMFLPPEGLFKEPNALQRYVARVRGWLRAAPSVSINTEIFSSNRLESGQKAAALIGRTALAEKEGIMMWILDEADARRFTRPPVELSRNELIANPRIMVAEGQMGSTFIGNSIRLGGTNVDVGLSVKMAARRAGSKTDLLLGFLSTEMQEEQGGAEAGKSVRTNAQVSARIQVARLELSGPVQVPRLERVLIVSERKDGKPPILIFVSAVWK